MAYVEFNVAPGVRIRPVHRSARLPLGVRLALAGTTPPTPSPSDGLPSDHTNDAELTDSSGLDDSHVASGTCAEPLDDVATWRELSGGGRRIAADVDADDDKNAWFGHEGHIQRLLSMHTVEVEHAVRPEVPPPHPVQVSQVRRQLRNEAVSALPWWNLKARRLARSEADGHLDDEVTRLQAEIDARHAARQRAADEWWENLGKAEPETSMEQLEVAFTRDGLPAVPAGITEATAYIVLSIDTPHMLIGEREPVSAGGGISLAIMSESRRNKLYVEALSSGVIATAADAFAVVPGLNRVTVAVVVPIPPTGPAVVALAEITRAVVLPDERTRAALNDLVGASQSGVATLVMERQHLDDAPQPLDPQIPAVAAILDALEA